MKLWPFGRQRELRASAAGGAIAMGQLGRPAWTPRNYAELADEAYLKNAVAFRCVKLIASSAAAIPWLLTRQGQDIDDHPLLSLLKRPGPMVGGHSLFEALYAYLLLAGNTYLEGVGPDGKPPKELWNLRPDRTKPIPSATGMPQGFEYIAHGVRLTWDVDPLTGAGPILHVKEFHPINDWYGQSRVEAAAYAIDRHNAASAHNKALLDNGARPSGALIFEPVKDATGNVQSAPEPVIQAAEKALTEKSSGPANAGRAFVFGGNVNWLEMGVTPKDMDFAAGKDDAARDICTAFGVPHVLIVPGQSTYNNIREAKLELWEDTILPLVDKVVDSLNAWLVPQFDDTLQLGVDLDEISALEPRRESKRASVVLLYDKGLIDDAEAREALQYGPRPDDAIRLQRGDGQVLASLIAGATKEEALAKPLYRYLQSVRLLSATDTFEDFLAGWSSGALTADDLLAVDGPAKPDPASQLPGDTILPTAEGDA
jgi:HK97 family phage portal protein